MTQGKYKELRRDVISSTNDVMKLVKGVQFIKGVKVDVVSSNGAVDISILDCKVDLNTTTMREKELVKFVDAINKDTRNVISMIDVDTNYNFKLFTSNYHFFGENLKYNIKLDKDIGDYICMRVTDIGGSSIDRVYKVSRYETC